MSFTTCTIWETWYSSVAPVTLIARCTMTSGAGSSMSCTRLILSMIDWLSPRQPS
jgi:hypothetical protein